MTAIDNRIWTKLVIPTGDKFVARLALPDFCKTLYCALDSHSNRHLLVRIEDENADFNDQYSRGFKVTTKDLSLQGQKSKRYIDLECLDVTGYSMFDLMGGEIGANISVSEEEPSLIIERVLAKWRRFWDQIPKQCLSLEEQIGLIGELLFIKNWLIPTEGVASLYTWRGPWGSRHDFEWQDKSVEVKTTTNVRGRIHKIHGVSQLENPESGQLFLYSVRLREEAGATMTLPGLVAECCNLLIGSDELLTYFENSLAHLGYSPVFSAEYDKTKMHLIEDLLFIVADDFPKVTTSSFTDSLSLGVEQLDYVINLNNYDHLIIPLLPIGV